MARSKVYVDSPLGTNALALRQMTGHEELGRLSWYELDLIATEPDLDVAPLLGRDMTLSMELPNQQVRHFHGYATEVTATGYIGRLERYRVTLRPWLWFLTRTTNCRIFQNKTVPEILRIVFERHDFTDVEYALQGSYRSWEYLVQYRESDHNFVTRLMEQEGLYFFFRHEPGKHTLVLADGYSAHQEAPGYEQISYYDPQQGAMLEREHIERWSVEQVVQPGSYVLDDYDFTRPRASLQVTRAAPLPHERSDYEIYDYPGEYAQTSEGENYARVRLESLHSEHERHTALASARGLAVGTRFTLADHPRPDQNAEYVVLAGQYDLTVGDGEGSGEGIAFSMSFTALRSVTPFRLSATTPRPVVHGPQTGRVVGKAGEEIWTDKYGRVKVQFPWDREGAANETSSCWVRVSQVLAGAGWGAMHVPRIGQEVVVSFLEGDPDRPLITGRVYNGTNMPPFDLPTKGMVSGIKTESSKGGGGYNEISLDDSKGSEKVVIHGQFDMNTTVEHDQTLVVHNNRTATIDASDTESVGGSQSVTVGGDQSTTVQANQTNTIAANQSTTVQGSHSLTVTVNSAETILVAKELTVGGAYQVSVGAAMNETVGGMKAEEVGAVKSVNVGASNSLNVAANSSEKVGGNSSESVGGNKTVSAGKAIEARAGADFKVAAGKTMLLEAGADLAILGKKKGVIEISSELTIKVGSAQITLKKNGDITIKGAKIKIEGSGDVKIKGSKISQN